MIGDEVEIEILSKLKEKNGFKVFDFDDYCLWKFYNGEKILVWFFWEKEFEVKCYFLLMGEFFYIYKI